MTRILFTISYEINPEKRESYLQLAEEMKRHLVGEKKNNYGIYEHKGKKNSFTEVFLCQNQEEFDQLEDGEDEKTEELVSRLDEFLVNGKMKYTTLVELGSPER